MSTALFVEFHRKAADILPENADEETTLRVAFQLMQSEKENEKKLMQSENEKKLMQSELENEKKLMQSELENEKKLMQSELENEKKLEVLKIKMEMEKKLELQEMKQHQSTAFHSKQLSAVVQRLVICMSVRIVNLFILLFFRHLPHHFFASSMFSFHTDKFSRAF